MGNYPRIFWHSSKKKVYQRCLDIRTRDQYYIQGSPLTKLRSWRNFSLLPPPSCHTIPFPCGHLLHNIRVLLPPCAALLIHFSVSIQTATLCDSFWSQSSGLWGKEKKTKAFGASVWLDQSSHSLLGSPTACGECTQRHALSQVTLMVFSHLKAIAKNWNT